MTGSLFHSLQFNYIIILFAQHMNHQNQRHENPILLFVAAAMASPKVPEQIEMGERARSPGLELRLNLSPPRDAKSPSADQSMESSNSSSLSSYSEMSCVSSEHKEETKAMLLVGCLRCLMYVLLSGVDPNPKCPNCKSRVFLDFLKNEENNKKTRTKAS